MGITHLDQLTLNTGPVLPAVGPYTGNWYFVNETTGSDGNSGAANSPLKTLSRAHTLAASDNNDVVAYSGTIHQTASLTWSKNQLHLIGMCAPVRRGKRARISVSGATAFTPLLDITGQGCHFRNFGTFYGFNSASNNAVCVSAAGQRNVFDNVELLGFGDGTATTGTANKTGSRACVVGGAGGLGENSFYNCVFGGDTIARGAANYTLEFLSGSASPRNYFQNCDFEMLLGAGGTAGGHLYAAASGSIDRYAIFEDCTFNNAVKSGGSTLTQLANIAASVGGYITMRRVQTIGVTHIETTPTNQIYIDMGLPSATSGGIMINNT